jgi:hypothetical protein
MIIPKKDETFWIVSISLLLISICIALISGYMIGESSEKTRLQREAIENGAARWKLNNDGKAVFEWFECK